MNKKRSNEYGFTLIELLVAIAIILSITALAIVNIVGTSKRKKEEAWVSVKEEIETATSDYFKANEYLFEGLEGNEQSGYITVGALVDYDFLNKVTDPRSGKSVSYCTKVNITKKGRGIIAKLDENSIEDLDSNPNLCVDKHIVSVSNSKNAPVLSVMKKCKMDAGNDWCMSGTTPTYEVKAKAVNDSTIEKIEKENNQNLIVPESGDTENDYNSKINTKNVTRKFKLTNQTKNIEIKFSSTSSDGSKTVCTSYIKWDGEAPKGNIEVNSKENNYNSNIVNIKLKNLSDNLSEISSVKVVQVKKESNDIIKEWTNPTFNTQNINGKKLFNNLTKTMQNADIKLIVKDKAGNEKTVSTNYKTYALCSNVVDDGTAKVVFTDCVKNGNSISQKVTNTQNKKDKFVTGQKCNAVTTNTDRSCECPKPVIIGTQKNGWYNTKVTLNFGNDQSKLKGFEMSYLKIGKPLSKKTQVLENHNFEDDGKYTYYVYVKNKSGTHIKCNDGDFKIDRTPPTGKVEINSRKLKYNTKEVDLVATVEDSGSDVDKGSIPNGFKYSFGKYKYTEYEGLFDSSVSYKNNNKPVTYTMTVMDKAGNKATLKSTPYSLYKACEDKNIVFGKEKQIEQPKCPTCKAANQKNIIVSVATQTEKTDKNTGDLCGYKKGSKNVTCNVPTCPTTTTTRTTKKTTTTTKRKCPVYAENNLPQFQAKYDEYYEDEKNDMWYYINSVELSYEGDANYWKWYNGNNEIKSCSGKNKCNINSEGKNDISLHGQSGEVCGPDTIYVKKQELQCDTAIKVSVEGNITNGNDSWYKRGNSKDEDHYINMKFTPSKYIKSFDYEISGGFNNSSGSSTSKVNVKTTNDIDGTVSYNVTLYGTDNKKINCSGSFKIDTKKPSCPDVKVDESDSSFKKGNNYGVTGENGWYRSSIKLIFDQGSDIKSWSWRETTSSKNSYVHIDGYDNKPLKLSNQGRTAIWLEITDKAGNYNSCGPKYYNIDTIPPVYHPDKTTYNKNITQWDNAKNTILVGKFKNNTICFINEPGDYDVPSATPYFTDNIGVSKQKTINNFGSIPRWCSPVYIHFNYYAEDAAGNSTTVTDPNEFIAAYILENGAPHYYGDCSYEVNSITKKRIFENQYVEFSKKANFWGTLNPGKKACDEKEPNDSVRYTR